MKRTEFFNHKDTKNNNINIFCFPYAGGNASFYRSWGHNFSGIANIVPIELPGHGARILEPPYCSLRKLVDDIAIEIIDLLEKPYIFLGYSMGTKIAFELMRFFQKKSIDLPSHFIAIASPAPRAIKRFPPIHTLPDDDFIDSLSRYNGMSDTILQDRNLMELLLPALRADFSMLDEYQSVDNSRFPLDVSIFGGTSDQHVSIEEMMLWGQNFQNLYRSRFFPGNHFFVSENKNEFLSELVGICAHLKTKLYDMEL
ncbi:thioesterase II family protein [Cellvibrio sp. PSBB006]|uniref:thioesterase II family protein n=1 Tax=Cellvibrio sp. PSBB006 TaxID=1987723 RepID=UPI000B3B2AA3|nr:alpha/beta fold hydrolase [Cellvibrio sp. PSBB006]ARU26541.1 hypothetical protein CBR65_03400 [Cellvibrio sp. PSBB006]